jgi:Tfp pilus assembly protein PilO
MNRNKLMLLVAVVAAIAVIAGGYFLGVQPQLARAESDRTQTDSVDASNGTTQAPIAKLQAQASDMSGMKATLATLQASVPSSPNASALISEINAVGDSAGVKVSSISVSDATAYSPPASTSTSSSSSTSSSTSTSGSTSTSSSTSTASSTATPSPSASPTAPSAPTATTNSAITSANFSQIPVVVTVNGSFAQALSFVRGLQNGERLMLVDAITSSSPADTTSGDQPTWTFSGDVYVLTQADASTATTTTTNG